MKSNNICNKISKCWRSAHCIDIYADDLIIAQYYRQRFNFTRKSIKRRDFCKILILSFISKTIIVEVFFNIIDSY